MRINHGKKSSVLKFDSTILLITHISIITINMY